MKLWLLRPVKDWEPWYDKAFGFVIRAKTEQQARELTRNDVGDEWPHWGRHDNQVNPWEDPTQSSCVELTLDGEPGLIIRDFAAA